MRARERALEIARQSEETMFRTARTTAPLFSLAGRPFLAPACRLRVARLGGLGLAPLAGMPAGIVVGCGDETAPATQVKKLDDPGPRSQPVSRLIQFYEDKSTADKHDKG